MLWGLPRESPAESSSRPSRLQVASHAQPSAAKSLHAEHELPLQSATRICCRLPRPWGAGRIKPSDQPRGQEKPRACRILVLSLHLCPRHLLMWATWYKSRATRHNSTIPRDSSPVTELATLYVLTHHQVTALVQARTVDQFFFWSPATNHTCSLATGIKAHIPTTVPKVGVSLSRPARHPYRDRVIPRAPFIQIGILDFSSVVPGSIC